MIQNIELVLLLEHHIFFEPIDRWEIRTPDTSVLLILIRVQERVFMAHILRPDWPRSTLEILHTALPEIPEIIHIG